MSLEVEVFIVSDAVPNFLFSLSFLSSILKMLEGRVANTAYICLGSLLSFGIREPDNTCAFRQTFGG